MSLLRTIRKYIRSSPDNRLSLTSHWLKLELMSLAKPITGKGIEFQKSLHASPEVAASTYSESWDCIECRHQNKIGAEPAEKKSNTQQCFVTCPLGQLPAQALPIGLTNPNVWLRKHWCKEAAPAVIYSGTESATIASFHSYGGDGSNSSIQGPGMRQGAMPMPSSSSKSTVTSLVGQHSFRHVSLRT